MSDTRLSIYPLPEALPAERGVGWKIRDGRRGRGVDFNNKVIRVPLDDSAVAHCARLQEVGRILWDDGSPVSADLETSLLFRAVDSHRINYRLHQAGVDLSAGPFTEEQLTLLSGLEGPVGELAYLLMTDYSVHGFTEEDLQNGGADVRTFLEVRRRIRECPTKANAVRVVGWLRSFLADMVLAPAENGRSLFCLFQGDGPGMQGCQGSFDDFFSMGWEELEEDDRLNEVPPGVRAQLPRELRGPLAEAAGQFRDVPCHLVPWGTMALESPPRTQSVLGRFMKAWRAMEEGVLPRYSHRYFVDGRVFARRRKILGGTVVIDASGSMALSGEQIQAMVECAPGCLVACYSGDDSGGVLRILAAEGKRVANEFCAPPCGGGNIVDFPALKWAYRYSHPRIWVSDVGVTGIHDEQGQGNVAMCAAAVKKGRFFQAHNTEEALAVLRRLGRYYRKG
jgi:hypothetical protein